MATKKIRLIHSRVFVSSLPSLFPSLYRMYTVHAANTHNLSSHIFSLVYSTCRTAIIPVVHVVQNIHVFSRMGTGVFFSRCSSRMN